MDSGNVDHPGYMIAAEARVSHWCAERGGRQIVRIRSQIVHVFPLSAIVVDTVDIT